MQILITGMGGSGGSYLAEYILEHHADCTVHGTVRRHGPAERNLQHVRSRVHVHDCELTAFGEVSALIQRVAPDAIFHLASDANVRQSFDAPLAVMKNNVDATTNLLEAVRLSGLRPKIQLCSTSEVYGLPERTPIDESAAIAPASPYAVSKTAQDLLGAVYHRAYGLHIVRTRMFTYLNPRRADLFATSFALQVARIEAGQQEVLRHGNLESVRTIVDVRDAMRAYWLALEKGGAGEVYNIGGDTTLTVGQFLELLKKKATRVIPSAVDPALLRPVDVTLQIPDVRKFKAATGWEPEHGFDASVQFLLDACRARVRE